ncbi:MAG: bifunctional UGMP family protein/serine/threonine protein kinase [Candidatus Bathyarchaeota archaeon BA2]|nr:MAG: bifunctional UGMP family protein/serine/threonine protein kinase [Candidatus Bathyarchaeota archaeon BA2]
MKAKQPKDIYKHDQQTVIRGDKERTGNEIMALLNENLKETVSDICMRIAASHKSQVIAACFYGSRVCGYAETKSDVHVLLVLSNYSPGLRGYLQPLNGINVFILATSQVAFERDVKQGWLGEFVAQNVTVPYEPFINKEYLQRQEVKMKRRIVWELLENIVSEFPELSHGLLIKAEYFMYEAMMRRARLFPLITYTLLNMLRRDLKRKNVESMMKGYIKALNELAEENWITYFHGHIKIKRKFIDAVRRRKPRLPFFVKSVQRAAFLHILSALPKMMNPLMEDQKIFMKAHRGVKAEEPVFQLEEPKKYLLMPTPLGPVALSDKSAIEDFVGKTVPGGKALDMKIDEIGGVLNDVYLLRLRRNNREQKVVVKKFRDWSGFKWLPLALWTLGTKTLAVLGRSRLEREYAINQFLHSQGFPVPEVLHVSPRERMIFEEFIEGEKMVKIIKRIISSRKAVKEAALVKEVGRKIAEAHRLGVVLGDCKPENIIVTKDGKTFFVDLEQAARDENQAWDVAEFLYYSGHHVPLISSVEPAKIIAKNFIEGYLEAGGRKETVKKAGSARYAKVFSVFTPPHVLMAISNFCQTMGKELEN